MLPYKEAKLLYTSFQSLTLKELLNAEDQSIKRHAIGIKQRIGELLLSDNNDNDEKPAFSRF